MERAVTSYLLLSLGTLIRAATGLSAQVPEFGPVTVVAPEVISNGNTWRGSFSPDGTELYFFRRVGDGADDYRIVVSRWQSGVWGEPEPVAFSGPASDLYPAIAPDGGRMILSSYRTVPGVPGNAHLFESRRIRGEWTEPRFVAELNQPGAYHAQPYFTRDGSLHFRRVGPGGPEVWRAAPDGEGFEPPVRLDLTAEFGSSGLKVIGAFFSPDECRAVLTVEVGRGDVDLYSSRRTVEGWSSPVRLGQGVNTAGMELFPFFSPDGGALYFVRDFGMMLMSPVQDPVCKSTLRGADAARKVGVRRRAAGQRRRSAP